jgi:hypothetical protein
MEYFYAVDSLSETYHIVTVFYDTEENRQYAESFDFTLEDDLEMKEGHLYELSEAHALFVLEEDDTITSLALAPKGARFNPLDACDFEHWLDVCEAELDRELQEALTPLMD